MPALLLVLAAHLVVVAAAAQGMVPLAVQAEMVL
jgi:hypothetical protein